MVVVAVLLTSRCLHSSACVMHKLRHSVLHSHRTIQAWNKGLTKHEWLEGRSQSTQAQTNIPSSKSSSKSSAQKKAPVDIIHVSDKSVYERVKCILKVVPQPAAHGTAVFPQGQAASHLTHIQKEPNLIEVDLDQLPVKLRELLRESCWTLKLDENSDVRWSKWVNHTYDDLLALSDNVDNLNKKTLLNFASSYPQENFYNGTNILEGENILNKQNFELVSSFDVGFGTVTSPAEPAVTAKKSSKKGKEKKDSAKTKKKSAAKKTKGKSKAAKETTATTKKKKKTKEAELCVDAMKTEASAVTVPVTDTKSSVEGQTANPVAAASNFEQMESLHPLGVLMEEEEEEAGQEVLDAIEEQVVTAAVQTKPRKLSKKQQKKKKELEDQKQQKELGIRGKEESFNQSLAAYLGVCVHLGMLKRADQTLHYYLQRARQTTKESIRQNITSVNPFNIVIMGYASKGNFKKVKELMRCLHDHKFKPDATTYALVLSCLGRQEHSQATTKLVQTYLTAMEQDGIGKKEMFMKADFVNDCYEYALKAIHHIDPTFRPAGDLKSVEYNCNLVNTLNETMHNVKVPSPANGVVTKEQINEWIEEQFSLEFGNTLAINTIEKKENSDQTNYFRNILATWEGKWQKTLHQAYVLQLHALKNSFHSTGPAKGMTLYPYLITLAPEEVVNIMMEEIRRIAKAKDVYSPGKYEIYRRLGEIVYNRYIVTYKQQTNILDKLKAVYQDYVYWYLDGDRKDGDTYIPRVKWQELLVAHSSGPSLEHGPPEWPSTVLITIGKFLYQMMFQKVMLWHPLHLKKHVCPVLYEKEIVKGQRTIHEIKPSPSLIELYHKASIPTMTFEAMTAPMVSPPIPWISLKLGGYLLHEAKIVRLPKVAFQQKQRMQECGNQQLYPVMDSLNQLSTIPWRVNKPMLDIIIELFCNNGCEELDIPQHPSTCPKPPEIHSGLTKTQINKIRQQQAEYTQKKNDMHSLWCDGLYKLSLANHFRDRVFWFPHNMDFRGRAYPCPPHLSHLNSDVFRSILQFARGEKLGRDGLKWLKLHLINLTGFVKRDSIQDRMNYCENVMEDILDSADQPLTGRRWWTKSDEPWQTLAACKELAAAIRSGNTEEYVSHVPIHQDGSCNGLQHYAALGRDKDGARSVNLEPHEQPQDVYSAIATLVENERAKDAIAGSKIARVLEGHIKRKVIKQTVMTTVYGVTRFGARLQIEKQLKVLDGFPSEQLFAASNYLVKKTFICLEKMFTSTREIQNWFTSCAKMVSGVCGKNLEYVTPIGLPVVQHYCKPRSQNVSLAKLPAHFCMDSYMKPNVMKQKNAFPPNFIHSLDSSHMMLTSLFSQKAGITFVSVHDCFWTHASSVDVMNKICRNQFVALHQEPILEELSEFFQKTYSIPFSEFSHDGSSEDMIRKTLNDVLMQVPPKGEFDITSVLKSTFFFS